MVRDLVINNELIMAEETMSETVTSTVSNMISNIETINNQITEAKSKCYLCSILVGSGIGICAFEVVRLIVSFI